ncbi:DUF2894 domain-containing protein [Bordetella trematum]|uniref:DUF2894 domain-containing protein n=1 Tax=Bordetella trematum TaxID=123899 RepID=UPI003AF37F5F
MRNGCKPTPPCGPPGRTPPARSPIFWRTPGRAPCCRTLLTTAACAYPELPLLDEVRAIWGRLNAERQLRQSIEQLPENAGPLNSDHVVLRALTHMRELSPDYLHHFMVYGETLAWLERMSPAPGAPARDGKPGAKNAGKPAAKAAAKPRKPRKTVAEAAPDEAGGER